MTAEDSTAPALSPLPHWTIPLVACQSQGGPYDDEAFQAGLLTGTINQALATAGHTGTPVSVCFVVPAALVPQLELLAMNHGLTHSTHRPAGDPGMVYLWFAVGSPDDLEHPERLTDVT